MGMLAVFLLFGGAAHADFRVAETQDVIYLVDGTKVEGTIIASGLKAVVIVVKTKPEKEGEEEVTKEVVVPKSKIERIQRGKPAQDVSSFQTDPVEGVKTLGDRLITIQMHDKVIRKSYFKPFHLSSLNICSHSP